MDDRQLERFMAKVREDPESGCWEWTGSKHPSGYGQFNLAAKRVPGRKPIQVHRVAYEHAYGPIPEGHQVHHECENRACCNPIHLVALTPKEHAAKGYWATMKVCHKKGHPMTEENTYRYPGTGWRTCLTCKNEGQRRRYRERKAV